jgi:hypothetical protein
MIIFIYSIGIANFFRMIYEYFGFIFPEHSPLLSSQAHPNPAGRQVPHGRAWFLLLLPSFLSPLLALLAESVL